MAALIKKFMEGYHYVNDELSDPRTTRFPLVSNPLGIIIIIIIYNVFVQCIGPRWMKGKKPYNLKPVIVAYDFIQIVCNGWMTFRILKFTYFTGKYNLLCQPIETGTSPEEIIILETVYFYFLTKILDLVDTVFFLLSKKSSHVSFLHLYHHSGMVVCSWVGIKFVPGGQAIFFGAANGFVHSVMYTYYLLTALKFVDSRNVFWKRYLTQLQLVQFGLIGLHHLAVILNPSCTFPRFVSLMVIPQNIFMFVLFCEFYRKTYFKKEKKA